MTAYKYAYERSFWNLHYNIFCYYRYCVLRQLRCLIIANVLNLARPCVWSTRGHIPWPHSWNRDTSVMFRAHTSGHVCECTASTNWHVIYLINIHVHHNHYVDRLEKHRKKNLRSTHLPASFVYTVVCAVFLFFDLGSCVRISGFGAHK